MKDFLDNLKPIQLRVSLCLIGHGNAETCCRKYCSESFQLFLMKLPILLTLSHRALIVYWEDYSSSLTLSWVVRQILTELWSPGVSHRNTYFIFRFLLTWASSRETPTISNYLEGRKVILLKSETRFLEPYWLLMIRLTFIQQLKSF